MENEAQLAREGRVWKFGDNINTDLIMPQSAFRLPAAEQKKLVFNAVRPNWSEQVSPGDIVIGGKNFGTGSGRPVGKIFSECGIAGLIAESINGLCYRNCINFSFPAMECKGIVDLFNEGDIARIEYTTGLVMNLTQGTKIMGKPMPAFLQNLVSSGGIIPMLIRDGYIESKARTIASS